MFIRHVSMKSSSSNSIRFLSSCGSGSCGCRSSTSSISSMKNESSTTSSSNKQSSLLSNQQPLIKKHFHASISSASTSDGLSSTTTSSNNFANVIINATANANIRNQDKTNNSNNNQINGIDIQTFVKETKRNLNKNEVRNDWTREEIAEIYNQPLLDLVYQAATMHRKYFAAGEVQQSTLMSIKTGGCTENCGYCSQSSHHKTFVKPTKILNVEEVLAAAKKAKAAGSTRFCMGSAWREPPKNGFKKVLDLVKEINGMGMEVCTTLGMLSPEQAKQLKESGLTAYNHNLDTSPEYYPKVVTTRTYEERLNTVENVRKAGISVCCGGIIGMGEKESDRVGLLHAVATMDEHPESVPINALVPVKGTPLGDALIKQGKKTEWHEVVRMIAAARVVMPRTMVRLSAGRLEFPKEAQALMFMAGGNSIFTGDTLLTTANPAFDEDKKMFELLGLRGMPAHSKPLTEEEANKNI